MPAKNQTGPEHPRRARARCRCAFPWRARAAVFDPGRPIPVSGLQIPDSRIPDSRDENAAGELDESGLGSRARGDRTG